MRNIKKKSFHKLILLSVVVVGILLAVTGLLYSSFALVESIKSVSFTSEKLNYDSDSGSWKVVNSAEWIDKGKARVTIQLDIIERIKSRNTDMIFVLDTSGSMAGEKLQQAKVDIKELFSSLLDTEGNKGALIAFDQDSTILSDFTDDRDTLCNAVDGLYDRYTTNYYQALVNVNEILRNYHHEEDRDLIVVFMTDGTPNEDTPNEVNYFKYLKDAYPYITVNAVQYEMGSAILDSVKNISDNQYIANIKTLKEVLFQASKVPVPYSEFQIENYIDTDYFSIENDNDIKVDRGTISFNKEEQKVIWNLDNLASGTSTTMTIDLRLKEEYVNSGGIYSTNKNMNVYSRIENDIESITNDKTPRLKNEYQVTYDGNLPKGCVVENIPGSKNYFTFDSVEIEEGISCEGYQFKGWKIVTENVNRPSENYFIMPESDVLLRGEWSDLSIAKSIDGTINQYVPPVLQKIGTNNYNKELWKYKSSITKIIIQDQIKDIKEATETFDISEGKNYGVVGYIVPNTDDVSTTTYTAYIQGEGKIKANENSSYLFHGFTNVESIEGLEYLDTSNVTNMRSMFAYCGKITNLDVSNFNTTNVTNMVSMFYNCKSLTSLNLSNFDTSSVTDMSYMFSGEYYESMALTTLNLSSFDTSNVTNMSCMFRVCRNLKELDISHFNTSKVTNMSGMFFGCRILTSLDVSHFDTSKVTNMSEIFKDCNRLASLDIINFNTSSVTSMSSMFSGCETLKTIQFGTKFDTSKVTSMGAMFFYCTHLTNLDLSGFNTSKVTSLSNMFYQCYSFKNLDLSHFDTSNVTDMHGVFAFCSGIVDLNISNFVTSNVKDFSWMFWDCRGLKSLDLSHFNTSKATNMDTMFNGCTTLADLNLSNFDTSNVTNMNAMFGSCSKLTNLNLSNFNTLKVTSMRNTFAGCTSLTGLNIGNFNTSNVTDMTYMFNKCSSLVNLDLSNFNTSNVTDMRYMFSECSSLKNLDLSSFNTSKVVDMRYMFNKCSALENLSLSSFDTSKVTDMEYMFNDCNHLTTTITISNLNTTGYTSIFTNAAISEESSITVNYTTETSDLVDLMIETKSAISNVIKGSLI